MAKDDSRQMYEDEAEHRGNYFFDIYEGRKSASPWYLKWYDQKHIDRKDWIQARLNKMLDGDKVFCDIGCSSGYFPVTNASKVKKAIGVDISEEYLRYARRNAERRSIENCKFVQGIIGNMEIDEKVDVMLFTQVLEHIKDDKEALIGLGEVGDTLIVTVPGMKPWAENARKKIWPDTDPSGHYRNYFFDEFKKLLEDTGWNVQEITEISKGKLSFNWIIGAVCTR